MGEHPLHALADQRLHLLQPLSDVIQRDGFCLTLGAGSVDITSLVNAAPVGQWRMLKAPLS